MYTEDNLCVSKNCVNLAKNGTIYCRRCFNGGDTKAPSEVILKYKPWLHYCGECKLRKNNFCIKWNREIGSQVSVCTARI